MHGLAALLAVVVALVAIWYLRGRLRPVRACRMCKGKGTILLLIRCPWCHGDGLRFTVPAAIARRRHPNG